MNRTRRSQLLSVALFGAALSAQEPIKESVDVIETRVAAGGELIEMQWQRDDQGRLLTRSKGSENWQPVVADTIDEAVGSTGVVGFLMAFLHGDNDLLGMTDGERHLRRVGISTADAELRTLLAAPLPAGADARHPAVLDHMVAIDLLRRRGAKSAVADLGALSKRDGVPAPLRQRAQDAAAALQGSTRAAPAQLDPATMPLPLVADGYLIFDNSRIPDTSRLTDLGRRMGMASSLAVIKILKAPTVEDCTVGQRESDSIGELAFELTRRLGNHRVSQGCAAVQWQPDAASQMGFCLQMAGAFDVAALAQGLPKALRGFDSEQADGAFTIKSPQAELKFEATRLTVASAKMGGKPRPEQGKQLLALGNAGIRVVLPAQSKAWLGMAALELPAAQGGEVTVTFVPEFVLRVQVSARDEDGAQAWVQRVNELLKQYVPMVEAELSAAASPALADLIADLKAIAVAADGKSAVVELRGKNFGWATIDALGQLATGH